MFPERLEISSHHRATLLSASLIGPAALLVALTAAAAAATGEAPKLQP